MRAIQTKTGNGHTAPKVVIAGAGPAGSSLAIRLVLQGFPVVLIERERFPRHKLCGEFISPECFAHFDELGVHTKLKASGGAAIRETRFFAVSGRSVSVPSEWLGGAALSLSRAAMDEALLIRARQSGVETIERASVAGTLVEGDRITGLRLRSGDGTETSVDGDIFVDATGRAGAVSKAFLRASGIREPRDVPRSAYLGFKAHLSGPRIDEDVCEIHSFPGGYGGFNAVEGGAVNHCFIVRADLVRKNGGAVEGVLEKLLSANPRTRFVIEGSTRVTDRLAVAVDGFGSRPSHFGRNLFTVGDSAAFIDPFTGSGILLALESSSKLAETIASFPDDLGRIRLEYALRHRALMRQRLFTSAAFRYMAFSPAAASVIVRLLGVSEQFRKFIARSTRRG